MDREYDIFEKMDDGSDLWRAIVYGLNKAQQTLEELGANSTRELYAIHMPTKTVAARINHDRVQTQSN